MNEFKPYAADEPLPELFRELQEIQDETNRDPALSYWALRAELPPGCGIVSTSTMLILTPLP